MHRKLFCSALLALGVLVSSSFVLADLGPVPSRVSYQGLLLDASGAPVDGIVSFEFVLFPNPTGGTESWAESHTGVPVVDGVYDV